MYILIQFSLKIVYYLHGSNDSVAVRLLGVGEPCSLAKILRKGHKIVNVREYLDIILS